MTYLSQLKYERVMSETMPVRTPSAPIKPVLIDFYLDYSNNYLTIEKLAEDYGISGDAAMALIAQGKKYLEEQNSGE